MRGIVLFIVSKGSRRQTVGKFRPWGGWIRYCLGVFLAEDIHLSVLALGSSGCCGTGRKHITVVFGREHEDKSRRI